MSLLWREQMGVGNDLIDDDHKHLFDLVNQAEEILKTKNAHGVNLILRSLADYSKFHFSREELIASAAGYPKVDQIHASHEALVEKLSQVTQKFDHELSEESAKAFVGFLREWLVDHVIKEDLLMKPYLVKHSPKFDPRN